MTEQKECLQLQPTKPTDVFWRGLYGIHYQEIDYVIEVDYFDINEKVRLYCNGILTQEQRSPAAFEIGGATIKASMALYGMKQAELVKREETASKPFKLTPLKGTAEAKRLAFHQVHPISSRLIAGIAWAVLVIAAITQLPNMLNSIGYILGFSIPSFPLPEWMDLLLGILGILAALDRALRMKHNPLLDD